MKIAIVDLTNENVKVDLLKKILNLYLSQTKLLALKLMLYLLQKYHKKILQKMKKKEK